MGSMADKERFEAGTEEWWRAVLTDPRWHYEPLRKWFLRIPSAPHCKVCGAPFKGIGVTTISSRAFSKMLMGTAVGSVMVGASCKTDATRLSLSGLALAR